MCIRDSPGDVRVFFLGTTTHVVAVEVKCLAPSVENSEGVYEYTIWNTGSGCQNHLLWDDGTINTYAKPMIIKNLNKSAFSYNFVEALFCCVQYHSDSNVFYEIHQQHLIDKAGGVVCLDEGKWYPLQKFNTCSFNAVEAWIQSYLDSEDIQLMNHIKLSQVIQKQKQVIRWQAKKGGISYKPLDNSEKHFKQLRQKIKQTILRNQENRELKRPSVKKWQFEVKVPKAA